MGCIRRPVNAIFVEDKIGAGEKSCDKLYMYFSGSLVLRPSYVFQCYARPTMLKNTGRPENEAISVTSVNNTY